jgi:hypothetical protein
VSVEYYSQRLLNPFRGCIRVIRYESAEAVSMDGAHWDIYVSNDALLDGLQASGDKVQVSDIRYGSWDAERGLKRGPLYPSDDFLRMEELGAVVYELLQHLHDRLPFPYRDRHELWLMRDEHRPLVLLHSAVDPAETALPGPERWQIGLTARERFASAVLPDAADGARPADYLMDYVNGLATGTVWFKRTIDGRGRRLGRGETADLPATAFPPLLLDRTGHGETHSRLIEDFLAWLAPWLLLLPDMDGASRRRLAEQARRQATEVDRLYRLYPAQVDPEQIRAARVEAMLSRCADNRPAHLEGGLSTFYIELDDGPV